MLWCGVDESLNETFRRLVSFRTNLFSIELINPSTPDPKGALQRTLDKKPAQIVVIDSLIEWTRRTARLPGADQRGCLNSCAVSSLSVLWTDRHQCRETPGP